MLSEEGPDDPARLEAGRLWIVDPLDGTWEYGQGRPDFAVHVALWWASGVPGGSLGAAAFDLPAQGRTWSVLDDAASLPRSPTTGRCASSSPGPVVPKAPTRWPRAWHICWTVTA